MSSKEPLVIRSPEDVAGIVHPSEQQFALAVLQRCPAHEIVHEPGMIEITTPEGGKTGTLPDFRITNPKNARTVFVEITQHRFDPHNPMQNPEKPDPKAKQKEIMAKAEPDTPYIVLYNVHLKRVQRSTGIPIFISKRDRSPRSLRKKSA